MGCDIPTDHHESTPRVTREAKAKTASHTSAPRIVGQLVTRVMVTEREPLFDTGEGLSIGQLVDRQLQHFYEQRGTDNGPVIHSITVELPVE